MVAETVSKINFWAFIFLFFLLIIPSKHIQVPEVCWMQVAAALKEKVAVVIWSDEILWWATAVVPVGCPRSEQNNENSAHQPKFK